jgi:hypothetical protein
MKQTIIQVFSLAVGLVMGVASAAVGGLRQTPVRRCGPDAVVAGTVCLDTYEASVWRVPNPTTTNANLVNKIQFGRALRRRSIGRLYSRLPRRIRVASCCHLDACSRLS